MNRELIRRNNDTSDPASAHAPLATLVVSVTCASISLIAASLTCWWFARMKRRLRHRLIMLLIISDMGKALWFFVGPMVALINGPVKSSGPFCQASGFFLAWATEASDFSALMLALHLVTCVFRPAKKDTEAYTTCGDTCWRHGFCYLYSRQVWPSLPMTAITAMVRIVTSKSNLCGIGSP